MDKEALRKMNAGVIEEFRANGGKVGGPFTGAPMLLLTTTGAKTGQPRISPLVHGTTADGKHVVYASKAGAPDDPDWFRNLSANPEVTVEVGDSAYRARARVTSGEERDQLFREQVARMPQFGEYAANTERVIPVVVLEPISS